MEYHENGNHLSFFWSRPTWSHVVEKVKKVGEMRDRNYHIFEIYGDFWLNDFWCPLSLQVYATCTSTSEFYYHYSKLGKDMFFHRNWEI